ncbi:hypothetical protein B0I35DRAFT_131441 [Stachybotrys elegans]|uniref:Transcription factor domain-containing protein n=1 Tax=Stachybotrys elegans TaxID=80388 RepID=A0A8K0WWA7_9HYPO|nr:hypothetical protein B0I35DRAFT_131441 [Stachybotrys elegans]
MGAQTPEAWSGLISTQRSMTTVSDWYLAGSNMTQHSTGMPSFDTSILLAAQLLQVKKQQPSTKTDFIANASAIRVDELLLISRFPDLPASNSYMALHYTPLYTLLAVSGESWVLNDKISHIESFVGLKEQLKDWQASGSCAAATVFAARTLRSMLKIDQSTNTNDKNLEREIKYRHVKWKDLSDYWAFYTSVLICWAFGHGKRQVDHGDSSLLTAISWIRDVANSQPNQLQAQACESETRALVGLGLELLKKDCLGNRNRLFADSINVLRRLQEVDRPRF